MSDYGLITIELDPGDVLTIKHPKFVAFLETLYDQLAANVKDQALWSTLQIEWQQLENKRQRKIRWSVNEPRRLRIKPGTVVEPVYMNADIEQYIIDKMLPLGPP